MWGFAPSLQRLLDRGTGITQILGYLGRIDLDHPGTDPLGGVLHLRAERKQRGLVVRLADKLDRQRQTVAVESPRNDRRGQSCREGWGFPENFCC